MEQIDKLTSYQSEQNDQNEQQHEQEEYDYRDIISKKKENYRVEIRKKKMNELLAKSRSKPILAINKEFVHRTTFNNQEDRMLYVQQLLNSIQASLQQARIELNEQLIEQMNDYCTYIIETVIDIKSNDQYLIEQTLKLGTIDVILPILEEEIFKEFIYLQSNVYNLLGSLFYADNQILQSYINNRVVNVVLNSLVSNESTIIEYGLFMTGNLISGNKKLKEMLYEQNLIDILFQIHSLDKLNTDNYGQLYYEGIKDYIWLISVFLEKNQGKFKSKICTKDFKKLIEISFDLACDEKFYESQDVKTTRNLVLNILDSVNTQDALISYFYQLQKIKNVNLIERFLFIMNNCSKFDIIVVQIISRFIFNVIAGPDEFCEDLLNQNILDAFKLLYEYYRDSHIFKAEIAWSVSNICTNSKYIEYVMDHPIYKLFLDTFDYQSSDVKREILYVAIQVFKGGNHNQMKKIISSDFMGKYIRSMNTQDTRLILGLLEGIDYLLHSFAQIFTADGENVILSSLEKYNLSGMLQELQSHKSESVYSSVAKIIQNHFQYSD
ncbi:importin subunit alpha, putative (macronuclear) [Tetrahymena thermophila SB210]|uniref:Importin subunit alpha, putative n=1 Tax=Tetrahymena thermophila (strain SB210) TaxID=312017 RepID=I7MEP6_TETTS|nr:importin subunit alpha, putative [Tetrahymena thermophila SB210]EAR97316.2 importin subunit alpha, putative [Tetrahymena thermophila SB210]|eukprot:XP_001017561.2 importin subunit alpha, putative [Tetrahymena thermophila SB210]